MEKNENSQIVYSPSELEKEIARWEAKLAEKKKQVSDLSIEIEFLSKSHHDSNSNWHCF